MENYFCANSVEEQVDYLTDKVKDIITNKLDKASIVQETGTGTDVVMSQKAVTDAIANKGLDTLRDVNLNIGNTTVQYDTTNGIQINSTARFTDGAGNHDAAMNLDLPVVGTDGIVIDKAADSEKIEISGKNFIKDPLPGKNNIGANIIIGKPKGNFNWNFTILRNTHSLVNDALTGEIVGYDNGGVIYAKQTSNDPWSVVNKEYADNNFVKKPEPQTIDALLAINPKGKIFVKRLDDLGAVTDSVAQFYTNNVGSSKPYANGVLITNDPVQPYQCANKKYVDDAIANISSTTQTKYQHNLILEGIKDGYTFKAFMSISRSDDIAFSTFDEVVAAIGRSSSPCTGYVYDGTKYYSIYVLDGSAPTLNYLSPDLGEQTLAVTNDDVAITDNVLEF